MYRNGVIGNQERSIIVINSTFFGAILCLGADINKADDYGRTPLHVAASSDYPQMVRFLIENGADFQATTKGELQTPLHFAARNEASQCIKILLAYGATLEVRDYKQRTPLQVTHALTRGDILNSANRILQY